VSDDADFDAVIRKFRREMLGGMVAHMDDEQVERFLEPFEALAKDGIGVSPEMPAWFLKRQDEARRGLLRILLNRPVSSEQ
jgi:hypothetical protein